jgi:hypothetical protein
MTRRTTLVSLGKALAKEISDGQIGEVTRIMPDVMAGTPEFALELLGLMASESAKKQPNHDLFTAYSFMLGWTLDFLRYELDRDASEATKIIASMEDRLLELEQKNKLDGALLTAILQQYAMANLPLSDGLKALMSRVIKTAEKGEDGSSIEESAGEFFADIIRQAGDDPFLIHDELAQMSQAFPEEYQAAMAQGTFAAAQPILQEAGLGWVLNKSQEVRNAAFGALSALARSGEVTPVMLRRLISMRNWLPAADRSQLDAVIQACRSKGVACTPQPKTTIVRVVASAFDGAGAQSFFVLVKVGRKHALASLLVKFAVGIPDAWVQHDMTKQQAVAFLARVEDEVDVYDASTAHLTASLEHFLAVGLEKGNAIPFGLLGFVETLGLPIINPRYLAVDDLVASLLDALSPEQRMPQAMNGFLQASADWMEEYAFLDYWFEDDGVLREALAGKKRMNDVRRLNILMTEILPTRRRRWAEMIAWTAAHMRHENGNDGWPEFAVVASELLSDRPLSDIPIMVDIALASIEAWKNRG